MLELILAFIGIAGISAYLYSVSPDSRTLSGVAFRLIFLGLSVLSLWTVLYFSWAAASIPVNQNTNYGNTTDTYEYVNASAPSMIYGCANGTIFPNNLTCSNGDPYAQYVLSTVPLVSSVSHTYSNTSASQDTFGGAVVLNFFSSYQWVIYTIFAILLVVTFSNTILPLLNRKNNDSGV
jgi:hypothetical protein